MQGARGDVILIVNLHVDLRQAVHGGTGLLHPPPLLPSVLPGLDVVRDRPDATALAHVEPPHRFLVGAELIGVEDPAAPHQPGITVLLEPLGSDGRALAAQYAHLGIARLLDGLNLLELTCLVVGRGREPERLPDGVDAGGSEVGLPDEGQVDGETGQAEERLALCGLLGGLVQAVAEAVLREGRLEARLRNARVAAPQVLEAISGTLEETEVCARRI